LSSTGKPGRRRHGPVFVRRLDAIEWSRRSLATRYDGHGHWTPLTHSSRRAIVRRSRSQRTPAFRSLFVARGWIQRTFV